MRNPSLLDIFLAHGSIGCKCVKLADYVLGGLLAILLFPQKNVSFLREKFKKILVIRPGGMGDALFLIPLLKSLTARGIAVEVLCEARNEQVFTSQGYPAYSYGNFDSMREMFANDYDMVVDSEQWHFLSGVIAYFIKTEYRVGFASRPLRGKLFNKRVSYDRQAYELDNFVRLFEDVLIHKDGFKHINSSFTVPSDVRYWASLQIPKESVAISLGGSIQLRRFTLSQVNRLIEQIIAKGLVPVLLGAEDVRKTAEEIMRQTPHRVMNYAGKLSLVQSAALLERVERLIATDSGLMHLACAVGTPVTAVFGPGHLSKWQPKGEQDEVISKKVSCSPCTHFGYTCPSCEGTYHCLDKEGYSVVL